MELEERIATIERISVRLVATGLLILALLALVLYGGFEFVKFVLQLWKTF